VLSHRVSKLLPRRVTSSPPFSQTFTRKWHSYALKNGAASSSKRRCLCCPVLGIAPHTTTVFTVTNMRNINSLFHFVPGIYIKSFNFFLARFAFCEKRLLASSCVSVRLHETVVLPLEGSSWNIIFVYFSKNLSRKVHVSLTFWRRNFF
jgi:hypothetical protein